jgi:hypothetical protein
MSESETRDVDSDSQQVSEEYVKSLFNRWEVPLRDLHYSVSNTPDDIPYLVLGHDAYSGCEAHIFTIADMTLWIPEFLPSGDVVLYYPIRETNDNHPDALLRRRTFAWEFITYNFDEVMHRLWTKAKYEYPSTDRWAHNEREPEGYIEIPENVPVPIDRILRRVDKSIRESILDLNRSGFATTECCSGLKKDHEGERPFEAYVCFDCEYYLDVSAHLFTLADLAGWDACWGAHGFDVLLYAVDEGEKNLEKAWKRLGKVALELGNELSKYRDLVEPWQGFYFYRFRKERNLFIRCYNEESRILSGFIEALDKIDSEFHNNDEE